MLRLALVETSAASPDRRSGETGTRIGAGVRQACSRAANDRRRRCGAARPPPPSSSRFFITFETSRWPRPPPGVAAAAVECARSFGDEVLRIEASARGDRSAAIANIINDARALGAGLADVVEAVSRVERVLRRDPAAAYSDMDRQTRDAIGNRSSSWRGGLGSTSSDRRACDHICERARQERPESDRAHHVGYYLIRADGSSSKSLLILADAGSGFRDWRSGTCPRRSRQPCRDHGTVRSQHSRLRAQ